MAGPALPGSFVTSKEDLARELTDEQGRLYRDHSWCVAAKHVLLRHGGRTCYVVATPLKKKRLTFAEIQYASDWPFFWEHRLLAHAALFPSTRAVGLFVDKRFAVGRRPLFSLAWKCPRLYRPARKEIEPRMIDGLYSELMNLKW